MNQSNEQQNGRLVDAEQGVNLLLWLFLFWSTVFEVFLHSGMGHRYLRINVIGAAVLIPFFACYWPNHDLGFLSILWLSFLFMVVVRQIGASSRSAGRCHSQYNGYPWLMRFSWFRNEVAFKQIAEPLMVFLLGAVTSPLNEPFGAFCIWGGICLFIKNSFVIALNESRLDDANDAMIEQELFAEQMNSRLRR